MSNCLYDTAALSVRLENAGWMEPRIKWSLMMRSAQLKGNRIDEKLAVVVVVVADVDVDFDFEPDYGW